jgi:DNA processing protein
MASELADFLRGRLAGSTVRPHVGPGATLAPLNPDYQPLWLALGHDPTGMDLLVERTGLTAAELSSMLLVMELDGRVAVEHGRYSRKT